MTRYIVITSGNFEPFQVRGRDLDSYIVTEDDGKPDKGVAIVMDGRPSIPLDVTNLNQAKVGITVMILNFWTPENFSVIYLKFKQRGKTSWYFVKKMQME